MTEAKPHNPVMVALGGAIALAAAMGIGRFAYTPILPFMVDGLGMTAAEAGVLASVNYLGYMLGALAGALAVLPGGRRLWFLTALGVSAATTLAMGMTESMGLFLALRFASGVASAFVLVFSSALVLDRLAESGRFGLSALHFAGVGSGIALSSVLIAALATTGLDWSGLWLASGAVALLALLFATVLVPPEGAAPAAPPKPTKREPINPRLVAIVVAYGLFGFGYVITATFISTIVRFSPPVQVLEPYVWLAVGLAAAPSVAFWGPIGRRIGNDRAFALACLVEAIGVAASVFDTSKLAILLAAILLGGTIMGITALGLIHARALTKGDPRRSMALMTASFGVGQMVGPTFAGYAHQLGDSFLVPTLIAAGVLLVAAFLVTPPWRMFERRD